MSLREEPEQIDRDYVRLLMVMRRFVRDEFDVKVAISTSDAAQTLLDYAGRSRNTVLQEMGKELSELLTPSPNPTTGSAPTHEERGHYYRGVLQPSSPSKMSSTDKGDSSMVGDTRKRIYRGRVVNG